MTNFGDQSTVEMQHRPSLTKATEAEYTIRRRNAVSAGALVANFKKGQSHQFLSNSFKSSSRGKSRLNWRRKVTRHLMAGVSQTGVSANKWAAKTMSVLLSALSQHIN